MNTDKLKGEQLEQVKSIGQSSGNKWSLQFKVMRENQIRAELIKKKFQAHHH